MTTTTRVITLPDGTVIEEWPGHHDELDMVIDPFAVQKHGSHDQSSHGNWAKGGKHSLEAMHTRLKAAFPNSTVSFSDGFSNEAMEGLTTGLEKMSEKFPQVADDIVLISGGPSDVTTPSIGETLLTEVENPDGENNWGIGLVFNEDHFGDDHLGWSVGFTAAMQDARSLVGSVDDPATWAEGVASHEFGHAVHLNAVRNASGSEWVEWHPTEPGLGRPNTQLFSEVAGQNGPFGAVSTPSMYPDTRLAELTQQLDQYRAEAEGSHGLRRLLLDGDEGVRHLSSYAGYARGEAFAEGFMYRHGPVQEWADMPHHWNDLWSEFEELANA